jgi:hypothetical protein
VVATALTITSFALIPFLLVRARQCYPLLRQTVLRCINAR